MKTRADFELEESPMLQTLKALESVLWTYFEITDWQGVRLIVAIAISHYTTGEMLWVRIIGPSRSGKTELFRAIIATGDAVPLESITPGSLKGGFKTGHRVLHRINQKLVITKDLAALLTARSDVRTEVLGTLRPIKDGSFIADFGTPGGYVEQHVWFDWLIATTPAYERYRTLESLLGERFIDMRWRPAEDREEMAFRAAQNNPELESVIRPEINSRMSSLMERAKLTIKDTELDKDELRIISQYADKTALLRTPVERDRYRNLVGYPEPEVGTDLAQGFSRIVKGLKHLGLDYEPYLNRLLWDSMPKMRS